MPTYEYQCPKCQKGWDVVKSMSRLDEPEPCDSCGNNGERQIARVNFTGAADWNTQTFNPALGCYTRNTRHAREIAKSKGWDEVGTEAPEKIHKHFERQQEDTKAQRWADVDRVKQYGD